MIYPSMKICTKCSAEKEASEFHKDRQKSDGLCSVCKSCNYESVAKWQKDNADKCNENTKKWQEQNPSKVTATAKNYSMNNKGKVNANTAKRAAVKLQRTPKWLSKLHFKQIGIFYDSASMLTEELGIEFEVDHIIPLRGDNVSGLHVPWNLQVITAKENRVKGSKYGR
jgi:hypothetical protein